MSIENTLSEIAAARGVDPLELRGTINIISTGVAFADDPNIVKQIDASIRRFLEAIKQPVYQPHDRQRSENANEFWETDPGIELALLWWNIHKDDLIAPITAADQIFPQGDMTTRNASTSIAYYAQRGKLTAFYRPPAAMGHFIASHDGKTPYKGNWAVLQSEVTALLNDRGDNEK